MEEVVKHLLSSRLAWKLKMEEDSGVADVHPTSTTALRTLPKWGMCSNHTAFWEVRERGYSECSSVLEAFVAVAALIDKSNSGNLGLASDAWRSLLLSIAPGYPQILNPPQATLLRNEAGKVYLTARGE